MGANVCGCTAGFQKFLEDSASRVEESVLRLSSSSSVVKQDSRLSCDFCSIATGVGEKTGKIPLNGRYNRRPKRLEDDYVVTNTVLGTGLEGAVYMAQGKGHPERTYAVKTLSLKELNSHKKELLESELEVFLHLDHPHVVRLYDVYEAENALYLVMEYMRGGELFDRVTVKKQFTESDAATAVWQMLLAVNYLHLQGMVHRDLKLENFLYDAKGSDILKLIDFGFSKMAHSESKMRECLGTMSYVAPEVLQGNYNKSCDLWSLGVITFILLAGYMPFKGENADIHQAILRGEYHMAPERWDHISANAKRFTKALLCVVPENRLTAQSALRHPWIMDRCKHGGRDIDRPVADALCNYAKASKFRRCCLEMMAWSLTSEESAKVMEDFRQIDSNQTGTISMVELKDVLVKKYNIADEEATKVFNSMDTNNDEQIHYSDFLAAMLTTRITLHNDLLQRTFKKFDTDGSGYITLDNLREVLGDMAKGQDVSELLAEADYVKDGRISYEEFVRFLNEHPEEASQTLIDGEIQHRRRANQGQGVRQSKKRLTLPSRQPLRMFSRSASGKFSNNGSITAGNGTTASNGHKKVVPKAPPTPCCKGKSGAHQKCCAIS
jgi:calcium-dependent protein kinase